MPICFLRKRELFSESFFKVNLGSVAKKNTLFLFEADLGNTWGRTSNFII